MCARTVADVMDRQVFTTVPDTPFREVVGLMTVRGVDSLPVVDPVGRLLGVISDADLLAKMEFHGGADHPPLLASSRWRARWHRSFGLVASDLMTRPAFTATEDTPLSAAVCALGEDVRRLYVVDRSGHLVGVLTRQAVLRLFLRCDADIRADVENAVRPRRVDVLVDGGVVTLNGALPFRSAVEHTAHLVHGVLGVIAVHNNLRYDVDDLMITGL